MQDICQTLNIEYPIIQGGMGNISNAQLTAAVSEAGGLGTIGCGTMRPDEVEKIIVETKGRTNKPFALNIALTVTDYVEELITLAIKYEIPVISLSAGNPAPYIPLLHEHQVTVIAIVATEKHAKKAEKAGADLLVAEGFEAAGINSNLELTTFTLIPQITEMVRIPVIAAGGIGDGKGLAAAMMLGASGVQLGTRLIATKEAPFHESYKQKLLEAEGTDAVIIGRSVGRVRRVIQTDYAEKLRVLERSGITAEQFNQLTSEEQHVLGAIKGELDQGFINGGQVAGLISTIPTVKELFKSMMEDANMRVNNISQLFTDKFNNIDFSKND